MPITKKDLTEALAAQTKHFDEKFQKQTKVLRAYIDRQTENLARVVAQAFAEQTKSLEKHFATTTQHHKILDRLDAQELRIEKLESASEAGSSGGVRVNPPPKRYRH